ncbi:hypothetical protein HDU86_002458 [Geranomyces michiganensis]|nr:hypothetical protein HDU86_002458 [Geranomyces michiganensis]
MPPSHALCLHSAAAVAAAARRAACQPRCLFSNTRGPSPRLAGGQLDCTWRSSSSSSSTSSLPRSSDSAAESLQPVSSAPYSRPPISPPRNPHTHLKIYVLPTLHHRAVFHPAFLRPRSPLERTAIVAAYILRKWRYQLSDTFAYAWHAFGAHSNGHRNPIYRLGNRLTTRRTAADEYLLKSIPRITETIEFIYPASMPNGSRGIKRQLSDSVLANSDSHRQKLFLWALLLPSALYVAKFYLVAANVLFSYNVFRLNASWRAVYGAKCLQRAIDARQVTWTASRELDDRIKAISQQVQVAASRSRDAAAAAAYSADADAAWTWSEDGDLHDEVVERLEEELKLAELSRTYRRARMQYFVHGPK